MKDLPEAPFRTDRDIAGEASNEINCHGDGEPGTTLLDFSTG